MKLIIPFIEELFQDGAEKIKELLIKDGKEISINVINWAEFQHLPDVQILTGHSGKHLWLHFQVKNDYIRAENLSDQEPVWQDACVEFFMMVNEGYRNFEFNCLGVCLSEIGTDRENRKSIPLGELSGIIRYPEFTPENLPDEGEVSDWSLTVGIPFNLTGMETGCSFKGNFYKCGDETKIPHYVSWSPIHTKAPDFHQPDFFGEIELEKGKV